MPPSTRTEPQRKGQSTLRSPSSRATCRGRSRAETWSHRSPCTLLAAAAEELLLALAMGKREAEAEAAEAGRGSLSRPRRS